MSEIESIIGINPTKEVLQELTYKFEHGSIYRFDNNGNFVEMGQVLHCLVAEDRLICHSFHEYNEKFKQNFSLLYDNIIHYIISADDKESIHNALGIVNDAIQGKGWRCE